MRADWKWLTFQVGLPLMGPIALAFAAVFLFGIAKQGFTPSWRIILDVTPWALATYSLTLIGSTLERFIGRLAQHKWLGGGLIAVAMVEVLFFAFLVVLRHERDFAVTTESYYFMGLLVVASITMCYKAR